MLVIGNDQTAEILRLNTVLVVRALGNRCFAPEFMYQVHKPETSMAREARFCPAPKLLEKVLKGPERNSKVCWGDKDV